MKKYTIVCFIVASICQSFVAKAQVPTLYTPADNSTNMPTTVSFSWSYVSSASGYQFEIATNSSFAGASQTNVFSTSTGESGLSPGTTYYWHVRSWLGGSNYSSYSSTNSFTVASSPVATFTATPRTVCQGSSVSFNSSGSSASTYSWSFQGGSPSTSTSANPTITYNSVGTFNVTLTVTTALGNDVQTKTGYITVAPNFSASINVTQGKLLKCPGDSVQLTASPIGTGYTYLWSNSDTASSIKTTQYGVFSVAVTNSGGCTKNISNTVTRDTLPLYINTPNGTSICYSDSVRLIVSDSGYFNYAWSSGQTTKQIITYQPATYKVYATDSNTCPRKGSVLITSPYINKKISVTSYASVICLTDSITLTSPSGFSGFNWSNSKTTSQITVGAAGPYILIAVDSVGCKMRDSVNLQFTKVPCYSGVYTIGGNTPDFTSPKAAMDSLNKYRISGKVIFRIRDGVYNDRLYLKEIIGSSKSNNITFESESGYAANVIITASDSILHIDNNVKYCTIKNITFKDSIHERFIFNLTYGMLYCLNITGCTFIGGGASIGSSSRGFSGYSVCINGGVDSSSFSGNSFQNMFKGIYVSDIDHTEITNNSFKTFVTGIETGGGSYNTITNNSFNIDRTSYNISSSYTIAAISILSSFSNSVIDGNRIRCVYKVTSDEVFGIYIKYPTNTKITNNNIYTKANSSIVNGAALFIKYGGTNGMVSHNNIIGNPAFRYRFISSNVNDSLSIINNNFGKSTGGFDILIWFDNEQSISPPSKSAIKEYRNNNYHNSDSTKSNYRVQRVGSGINDYSEYSLWKGAQTFDKDSRFIDPQYVSSYDLTPRNIALNNTADFMALVPNDINGTQRNTSKTDIGSYEINTFKDLKIDSVLLSGSGCNNNVSSKLRLKNNSLFYKVYKNDSVNIYYNVNGGAVQVFTYGFKQDSLNFNDTALVNIPNLILNPGIVNTIRFWINYTNDSAQWNDSISHVYYVYNSPSVDFTSNGFCAGTVTTFTSQTSPVVFYKWSFPDGSSVNSANASKVLAAGNNNITLQVTNAQGCSNTITKQVTVFSLPSNTVTRTGDSLSTVAGMSYQWFLNNNPLTNDTLQKVKIKQSGNYKVTVTSPQGCSNSSTNVFYAVTGIKGFDNTDQVMVYPVPATNELFIELAQANSGNYILTDVTGKKIAQGILKQGLNSVGLDSVTKGIYFIIVQTAESDQLIRKIIKE